MEYILVMVKIKFRFFFCISRRIFRGLRVGQLVVGSAMCIFVHVGLNETPVGHGQFEKKKNLYVEFTFTLNVDKSSTCQRLFAKSQKEENFLTSLVFSWVSASLFSKFTVTYVVADEPIMQWRRLLPIGIPAL